MSTSGGNSASSERSRCGSRWRRRIYVYIGCSHRVSADLQVAATGRRLEQRAGASRPESGQAAARRVKKKKGGKMRQREDIETGCTGDCLRRREGWTWQWCRCEFRSRRTFRWMVQQVPEESPGQAAVEQTGDGNRPELLRIGDRTHSRKTTEKTTAKTRVEKTLKLSFPV